MNVVVLDGEPLVRQELRRILQSANPEWSVLEAGNVRDATDLLIRESITILPADDADLIGCARAYARPSPQNPPPHPRIAERMIRGDGVRVGLEASR